MFADGSDDADIVYNDICLTQCTLWQMFADVSDADVSIMMFILTQ